MRCSPDGEEQTLIVYDASESTLRIDLVRASLDKDTMPKSYYFTEGENPVVSAQEAPFELAPSETLDLRIYLDRSVLEVYANGRQCLTQRVPCGRRCLELRHGDNGPLRGHPEASRHALQR